MGTNLTLTAEDGHQLSAYEAKPSGAVRGGLVVVQEIFGVTPHIRRVTDGYAAAGYHAIAPAVFDRAERGVELDSSVPAERDKGIALAKQVSNDVMLRDIAAAGAALKRAGKVGIVGYCRGGSLAWLTATRLDGFSAAVGYYGSQIAAHAGEKPRCPVMLHFGELDQSIPAADIDRIGATVDAAMVQIFVYPGAGHAFNRDGSAAWHEASAKLALDRTLKFLARHVG